MRGTVAVLAMLALPSVTIPAGAQARWSAELDLGAAVPINELAGAELQTGLGFGANLRYRFMPHLSSYVGWEWHRFRTEELLAPAGVDAEETGYTFGLRFEHPLAGRTAMWLRLGGLGNHIELEDESGDIISDTGHGLGFEAGGGLVVPLGERLALTPGVRLRSLRRDLEIGTATRPARLSYLTIGAGVAWTF